jgi:hypothetical protein
MEKLDNNAEEIIGDNNNDRPIFSAIKQADTKPKLDPPNSSSISKPVHPISDKLFHVSACILTPDESISRKLFIVLSCDKNPLIDSRNIM